MVRRASVREHLRRKRRANDAVRPVDDSWKQLECGENILAAILIKRREHIDLKSQTVRQPKMRPTPIHQRQSVQIWAA